MGTNQLFESPPLPTFVDPFQLGAPDATAILFAIALVIVAIALGIAAGIVWERTRSASGGRHSTGRREPNAEVSDRVSALETLARIEQAITSALSLSERLELLLQHTLTRLRADIGIVFLVDPATHEVRVCAQQGTRFPDMWSQFKMPIGEGVAGWIAEQGKPLTIPMAENDPRWLAKGPLSSEGVISYLGVPLRTEGRVIGVLSIATRARREFTAEQVGFVDTLGSRAAVAIENAQLYEQARQRANVFEALAQTTHDIAAQQDLPTLLKTLVERAIELLHARNGHIYLFDSARGDLELAVAVKGFPIPVGTRLALGDGMAGRVAQSRQPIIVDDYHAWEHRSPQYDGIPFTAALQVPMIYRGELIGVLGINEIQSSTRKFSESDAYILSLLATHAASVVRNTRLLDETSTRATELEAVHRASIVLTSSLDLREVLDEIIKSAFSLLSGARNAHIFLYEHEQLVFGAARFADGKSGRQFSEPRPDGLTYTVARSGEMIVVPDMRAHPLYANAPETWSGAIIGLPLKVGERVLGVMNIAYRQPRAFPEAELRVLGLLGDQAAVAIANAQLHEDVQVSETRYRTLVENIPIGLYRCRPDASGGLVMANPSFLRMFGLPPEAPVEQLSVSEFCIDRDDWKSFSDNVLRQGSVTGAEMQFATKDGGALWGLVTARTVYQEREPYYLDCTIEDITARKHAEEQLRRQANEMAAITRVGQEITSVPDLEPVLASIARNAAELSQSDASGVFAYEPDGLLRIVASHGVSSQFTSTINAMGIKLGQGVIGRAALDRRPVQISDVRAAAEYPFSQLTTMEGIRSLIAVPMLRGEEIKGGIVIWRREPHTFSEQEMTFLQALAQQCLNAIENARLFEETHERAEQLSVLNEISRSLASTVDLSAVYRTAHQHISRLVDCPIFGLALVSPEGPTITTVYSICDGQELDAGLVPSLPCDPQSPCGRARAIASGRPVISSSPPEGAEVNPDDLAVDMSSALYLPIMVENQVIGVLEMQSHHPQAYKPSDAELLGPVANQVGLAIKNAQLFAQVQRRVQELDVINQISSTINQPIAIGNVLTNMLSVLSRALDLDRCMLATLTESRDYLKVVAEYDPSAGPSRLGLTFSTLDNTPVQNILRVRRAQILTYAEGAARPKEIDPFGSRSLYPILLVPLITGDETIGAFILEAKTSTRVFSEAEVVLAQTVANQAAASVERARLFDETQRRADQLALLNRIANAINRARNLDELLEIVYREITQAIPTDAFFLALYDAATNELDHRVRVDEGVREPPERRPLASGLTAHTIKTRRPLLIRDWEREKELYPLPQKVWGSMKWARAWLSVPMLLDDQAIGIISLQAYYPNAFGKEEERLVMTVADQIATVIQRARLLEETQLRALEQETISEIARALNASLDIQASLPIVAEGLRLLTRCDTAMLALLDEKSRSWSTRVLGDASTPPDQETTLSIAETSVARNVLTGRVDLVGDLADVIKYPAERRLYGAGYRSQLSLPLIVGERVIGALNLVSRQVGAFSVRQLPALQQISASVAIAVENARLFVAEQARRAELSALYDLSRCLADATDFDVILNLVAQRAVETLHVTFARIVLLERDEFVIRCAYPARALDHDLAVGRHTPAARQPFSVSVLQQNAPVLLQRTNDSIDPAEKQDLLLQFAQMVCMVPLRAGDRAFGILMLGEERNPQREPFGEEKVRLAHSIGDQAASALRRAELFVELEHSYLQSVLSLAKAVDVRDTYTADHAQRLAEMALTLGKKVGLAAPMMEDLRYGALLHDIGKIGVPDSVLLKPGPLSEAEWQQMRRHPEIGEQIIRPIPRLAGAAQIVRHHHERVDGKGYPDGLAGEQIPLGARVLSIVDAYSAMRDQRVYKLPLSVQQTRCELMAGAGTQFDASILQVFVEMIDESEEGRK